LVPIRVIALYIVLLATPITARAQSLAPQTTWVNDHARFEIQSIDPDGRLTGTYENFGTNFTCAGQAFPATGWVDGERISYVVRRKNPGNCTSVQAWTGYVRGDELLVEFAAVVWDYPECRPEGRGSILEEVALPVSPTPSTASNSALASSSVATWFEMRMLPGLPGA
jgi:Avidin family